MLITFKSEEMEMMLLKQYRHICGVKALQAGPAALCTLGRHS